MIVTVRNKLDQTSFTNFGVPLTIVKRNNDLNCIVFVVVLNLVTFLKAFFNKVTNANNSFLLHRRFIKIFIEGEDESNILLFQRISRAKSYSIQQHINQNSLFKAGGISTDRSLKRFLEKCLIKRLQTMKVLKPT